MLVLRGVVNVVGVLLMLLLLLLLSLLLQEQQIEQRVQEAREKEWEKQVVLEREKVEMEEKLAESQRYTANVSSRTTSEHTIAVLSDSRAVL